MHVGTCCPHLIFQVSISIYTLEFEKKSLKVTYIYSVSLCSANISISRVSNFSTWHPHTHNYSVVGIDYRLCAPTHRGHNSDWCHISELPSPMCIHTISVKAARQSLQCNFSALWLLCDSGNNCYLIIIKLIFNFTTKDWRSLNFAHRVSIVFILKMHWVFKLISPFRVWLICKTFKTNDHDGSYP